MSESHPKDTPMLPISNHKVLKVEDDCNFPYKQAIGALLHLVNCARPDVAFSVCYLARFQSDPQKFHWVLVKRVLRYLKATAEFGIFYKKSDNPKFEAYVDADHAADASRRLTSGYVINFGGNPII